MSDPCVKESKMNLLSDAEIKERIKQTMEAAQNLTKGKVETVSMEKMYRKFPEIKKEDVDKIVEWSKQQPHLPELEEQIYLAAYHSCFFDVEKSKRLIEKFLTFKTRLPEIFLDMDPTSQVMVEAGRAACIGVLPTLTDEGYGIMYGRMVDFKCAYFFESVKLLLNSVNIFTREIGCLEGFVGVMDCEGGSMYQLSRVPPSILPKVILFIQECSTLRMKEIHFLNCNAAVDKVFTLIKPMIKKSLWKYMQFHRKQTIFKYVPKRCLPYESGGTLCSIQELQDLFHERMKNNRDQIIHDESLQVDETKRLKPSNWEDTVFGINGQFRNLEID